MKYSVKEITSSSKVLTKDVFGEPLKHLAILDKGENKIGQFNIYAFKKAWQNHIITPPFIPDTRLEINTNATNAHQVTNFHFDVLEAISDYVKSLPSTLIELTLPPEFNNALPFIRNKFEAKIRYTYLLDLTLTEEELLSNMSSQRRKNIKDGLKSELTVKPINDPKILQEKALDTLETNHAKFNRSIVSNLSKLVATDRLFAFGVFDKDQLVALSSYLLINDEAIYLFGWNSKEAPSFSGTLALWSVIQHSNTHAKKFNFAGSQIPSIEKYFRGFGGKLTPMLQIRIDKRKITKFIT